MPRSRNFSVSSRSHERNYKNVKAPGVQIKTRRVQAVRCARLPGPHRESREPPTEGANR